MNVSDNNELDDVKDFNWADTESVVIRGVEAVAVYRNPHGDVVIRQADSAGLRHEEPCIVIPVERVQNLIASLQKELED
jgi:hypothetical protein